MQGGPGCSDSVRAGLGAQGLSCHLCPTPLGRLYQWDLGVPRASFHTLSLVGLWGPQISLTLHLLQGKGWTQGQLAHGPPTVPGAQSSGHSLGLMAWEEQSRVPVQPWPARLGSAAHTTTLLRESRQERRAPATLRNAVFFN